MEFHLTATGRHLQYGIKQCYLPPDTSERAPPSPQPVSRYSIYLPRRDGRLRWPRLPGNAPAGNRTCDRDIRRPTTTLTGQPRRCRVVRTTSRMFWLILYTTSSGTSGILISPITVYCRLAFNQTWKKFMAIGKLFHKVNTLWLKII